MSKHVARVLAGVSRPQCQRVIELRNGANTYCTQPRGHEGACDRPENIVSQHFGTPIEVCEAVNPKTGQRCGCPKGHESQYRSHTNGGRSWV